MYDYLNELEINKPGKFPYFQKWKDQIIKHIKQCQNDGMYEDINLLIFSDLNNPYNAIEYLIDFEYLNDSGEDEESNLNFIKTGKYD